jgi:hypothetical protein
MASVSLESSRTEPSLFFVPTEIDLGDTRGAEEQLKVLKGSSMMVGGVNGDPVRRRFGWCVLAASCVLLTGASLFGLVVGAAAVVLVVGADTGGEGRAANSRSND